MRVTLDESGKCFPDHQMLEVVKKAIADNSDFHTSNQLAWDLMRAELFRIPVENRPSVEWFVYGHKIRMNQQMRSQDAYCDPRMNIAINALCVLAGHGDRYKL